MEEEEAKVRGFHEMEIDDRILKAVARLGWIEPTLIQEKAIPLLLEGKDVLVRARTGSGKTAAFAIPLVQKILTQKPTQKEQVTSALILAPTKELCNQISKNIQELTVKCSRDVACLNISSQLDLFAQKPLLLVRPDVIVGTPARALAHLKANNMVLNETLHTLVIDEADLIFSFGFEDDVKQVLRYLPKVYQAVLASATLNENVLNLKRLVLHNPITLKLQEPELAPSSQLSHYHLSAEEEEKAVILYVLLKLHLIRGKSIVFVNSVDKCYRLKLYLEQFGIPTCVLNSELPAAMRCHSVSQFNGGAYDIIIASDEDALDDPAVPDPNKRARSKDKESGVVRGIDFQFVSNILNFDFPKTVTSYIHRAGRTARGNNEGTALSFVSVKERPLLDEVEEHLKTSFDDESQSVIKAYEFRMEEVEGFRYRARDAWRAVTKIAIREARLKEIKQEVVNNNKLKGKVKKHKKRSPNFTLDEQKKMMDIILTKIDILECKKSDMVTWTDKQKAWKNVEIEYNASLGGEYRTWVTLKSKYEALKISAKRKPPESLNAVEEMVVNIVTRTSVQGLERIKYDSNLQGSYFGETGEENTSAVPEELYGESLNQSFFEDNPRDLMCLRHDKALHTVKVQSHLANVPEYIIPKALKHMCIGASLRKKRPTTNISKTKARYNSKVGDPLLGLPLMKFKKDKKKGKRGKKK